MFLLIWAGWEVYYKIQTEKKYIGIKDSDKSSLTLNYISILFGYSVGIPLAFSRYGKIDFGFPQVSFIGLFLIGIGLWIRIVAIKTLKEQFTYTVKILNDHKLITRGIYHYLRHPAYVGQLLILFGIGTAFSNWLSILLIFVPNFLVLLYRISIEEKALIECFAAEYLEYKKRTKGLVPWLF